MSADLIAKLKATEAGRWSHWLWEFLYQWRDRCQKGILDHAQGWDEQTKKENGDDGVKELRKLYDLADWLEEQAFKRVEDEIPNDTVKLMELYHRQKRREEEMGAMKEETK